MSMTDPIANFLTVIRNASKEKMKTVDCPSSKLKEHLAQILKKEGYVANYKKVEDKKQGILRVYLKYGKDRHKVPAITGLKRISKPGLRIYKGYEDIRPVLGGLGIAVISTSKGIKTDKECRDNKIGGEVLCHIW